MNPLKIIIVEDNAILKEDLRLILEEDLGYEVIATADEQSIALEVITTLSPDIVFVDIELKDGKESGIELVKRLSQIKKIAVIYMTSHYKNKLLRSKAFKTEHAEFLNKPVDFNKTKIEIAIERVIAKNDFQNAQKDYFFIYKKRYIRVNFSDIIFIEATQKGQLIRTVKEDVLYASSMTKFITENWHESLERIHRSFIINFDKVVASTEGKVFLNNNGNEEELPVSKPYRAAVKKRLNILNT